MKRAVGGILVVLALTFGLAARGESGTVLHEGCVRVIAHNMRVLKITTLKTGVSRVAVSVRLGEIWFGFHPDGMRMGFSGAWLTHAQFATWGPELAQLRAAAVAKVKVRFSYDDLSRLVESFSIHFDQPC